MSVLYFVIRILVSPWYDTADHAIINALLCISDALWVMIAGKFFGWW